MRVLSICTGMGLLDRAFLDQGFSVVAGCEIDPEMRAMYRTLCSSVGPRAHDLADMIQMFAGQHFDGIIGGPPCQAHSVLRAMRDPKFPDLTSLVQQLLDAVRCDWYIFENVRPIALSGARHTVLNAMHYYQPHQSRERWFTYSGLQAPAARFHGDVDDLQAYPVVAGRIYGPKRGAWLQGYQAAASLPFPCVQLQKGLANAVPYPLGLAWADEVKRSLCERINCGRPVEKCVLCNGFGRYEELFADGARTRSRLEHCCPCNGLGWVPKESVVTAGDEKWSGE